MWNSALETELSDADWVERVSTALLRLDTSLGGPDVYQLALGLCSRPRWRTLRPEDAARKAIEEPEAVDGV
jgi:hypothetical protein